MSKLTERIETQLALLKKQQQQEAAEAVSKARAREEQMRQYRRLQEAALEESIRAIDETGAAKMLSDINKQFLKKKGRIQKAQGNFSHTTWGQEYRGRDVLNYESECNHILSCVRLSWQNNELGVYVGSWISEGTIHCRVKVIGNQRITRDQNEILGRTAAEYLHKDEDSIGDFEPAAYPSDLPERIETTLGQEFVRLTTEKR